MESSTFDRLTRMIGSTTRRRTALAASAATGLAALTVGTTSAKKADDELSAEARRRARRGRRGKRGKKGAAGPVAGSGINVVTQACTTADDQGVGSTHDCVASCGAGYVATGGGYEMSTLFSDFAVVRQSKPDLTASNVPQGWFIQVQFIAIGEITYDIYAICVPS